MRVIPESAGAGCAPAAGAKDYFAEYLSQGAVFAALLRGAECALMAGAGPFAPPALDLGCGDGFFASLAGEPFLAGLDPDPRALRLARPRLAHAGLAAASACAMPFRSGGFATVMANSVLEHIPDLAGALLEIRRVLRPGGRLLITVPSHRFADLLGASRALRAMGWESPARWYGNWFNGHSRHFHTLSAEAWRALLAGRGFRIDACHYYFSPAAMGTFDLAHYLSVPRLASRALTGRWVAFPRLTLNRLYTRWWRRHADPSPRDDGAYLFLAARAEGRVG
jgi:SAM-dependent methyltransferase